MACESGGEAQGDEDPARDVALIARPTRAAAEPARDSACEKRPDGVAGRAHAREQNTKRKNLCCDVAARRVYELRYKSEEEKSRLRIKYVDDNALAENSRERCSRGGGIGRGGERFFAAQTLNPEKNEIARAEIFYDAEGGGRGDEQCGQADGGGGGVNDGADADAQGGDIAGIAALAYAPADDIENGWTGDGKKNEGGAYEEKELRVRRKHCGWMAVCGVWLRRRCG